jgi:hypothetical protein
MTICIGLTAFDGVVIAADAQESDQYYKRSQQKILPFVGNISLGQNPSPPQMACAFTGAGDAGYLDAFFAYALEGLSVELKQHDLQAFLADKVLTFHEKYLFPLAVSPDPPGIDVLIGAYATFSTSLFVSHGATLRRAMPHAAVGAGAHFALSLINDIGGVRDLRHTELLAAYVVGVTKERIEGCGKYTAIVSIRGPQIIDNALPDGRARLDAPASPLSFVSSRKIRRWEQAFGDNWAPRQVRLVEELMEQQLAEDDALEKTNESMPLPVDQPQSSKP